jgi:adenosyl cobinamide kinase/adenosyl cobinamide phosphate guanylyltransferase
LVLVSGGARSGKSVFAEALAETIGRTRGTAAPLAYIATGQAMDPEFEVRIAAHRRRRGAQFVTHEEPLELEAAMDRAFKTHDIALVECFPTWLGNLYHYPPADGIEARLKVLVRYLQNYFSLGDGPGSADLQSLALGFLRGQVAALPDLGQALAAAGKILLAVTNETGLGIIPAHAAGRRFRDDLGWLNQQLAALAIAVFFSVAGIPQRIK